MGDQVYDPVKGLQESAEEAPPGSRTCSYCRRHKQASVLQRDEIGVTRVGRGGDVLEHWHENRQRGGGF